MKNTKWITALLLLVTTMSYSQDKKAINIDDSKVALHGYSPVSYLDLGLAQRGSKEFKSEYGGVKYFFTSTEQKQTFDKRPSKYIPQFGGYCAFGIYAGAKFRVDPNKFVVSNGKYYLFLNDVEVDAKQLWIADDEAKLLMTANTNWKSLKSKN